MTTKPTKAEIGAAIAAGMNVWEQAAHFGVGQWRMSMWRKSYGITQRRTAIRKYRPNHNRITTVNLLGAQNYNYSEELEKDFHRLHEAKFGHLPWEVFRGQISELCARGINPLGEGRVA